MEDKNQEAASRIDKVYQVIEGYCFIGEVQNTYYGTYSDKQKAQKRIEELIKLEEVDEEHVYIKELLIDVDIKDT